MRESATFCHRETGGHTKLKKGAAGALICVALVLLDQFTKRLAEANLMGKEPFVLIDGVFELRYLENRGAAFGILQGKSAFFAVFTVIVLIGIAYVYLMKIPAGKRYRFLDGICILFFAGAVGNFIDRLSKNYVVDFFYFKLINFPIFNVADICVTAAACLTIVLGLFYYKEDDYNLIFPPRKKGGADAGKE